MKGTVTALPKYKIIALCGEAGSGKDFLLHNALEWNPHTFHKIVSYTTRPKREKEIDGVDYHFISNSQFTDKFLNGELIEAASFNGWMYGTGFENLRINEFNIGVFSPAALSALHGEPGVELLIFYVSATPKERLLRQLKREENPDIEEIIRRYQTDKRDFDEFQELFQGQYITLKNNKKSDVFDCLNQIQEKILTLWPLEDKIN